MTYCAGFFNDDYILLVSDTIESRTKNTNEKALPSGPTFFGEQTDFEGFEVSDTALKIFEIDRSRLIGAAGDKHSIKVAVTFLREHSANFESPEQLVASLEASSDLKRNSVQLIIAQLVDGRLSVGMWAAGLGYNRAENKQGKSATAVVFGSAMQNYSFITENVMNLLAKSQTKKIEHLLPLVGAYHQIVGANALLTKSQFGGAFVCAALTKQGVVWQPDTTYFLYSPSELDPKNQKLSTFEAINLIPRDGVVYVERRTPEFRNLALTPFLSEQEVARVLTEHGLDMYETALNLTTEYKVFVSREHPHGVLLHHAGREEMFKHELRDDGATAHFSAELVTLMKSRPELTFLQGSARIEVLPRGLFSEQTDC